MSSRPHQATKQGTPCLKNIQTRNASAHEVLRLRSTKHTGSQEGKDDSAQRKKWPNLQTRFAWHLRRSF